MIMIAPDESLPETPVRLKRSPPGTENPLDSPSTPGSPMMLQVKYRDYQSAIQAIRELEQELNEFQLSSHELEKELENELLDLELQNEKLKQENDEVNQSLKDAQYKNIENETKYNKSKAELMAQIKNLQAELTEKNSRLVDIEIINDNFEQNERNYEVKYNDLQEQYNQSLEKVVILETEISETSSKLLTEQLNHQNTQNELNEYRKKYEDLLAKQPSLLVNKTRSNSQITGCSAPRQTSGQRETCGSIPTSTSLMALHSLVGQSQGFGSRLGSVKSSLTNSALKPRSVSKSSPTTKLSSEQVTISTPSASRSQSTRKSWKPTTSSSRPISSPKNLEQNTENVASRSFSSCKRSIPSSPSSFQLNSLMQNKNLSDVTELEAIEGSPNKELQTLSQGEGHKVKQHRFGHLMSNPFKAKPK